MIEPLGLNFEKAIESNVRIETIQQKNGYLDSLIKFQSLFGVTYFGNTFVDSGKKLSLFLKTCLVCYDLLLIALFILFEYFAITDDSFNRTFDSNNTNKMIMNIIFSLSTFAMLIEFTVIKVVTLIRGKTIINNIVSFGESRNKSETKSVVWIYSFVILMCSLGSVQIIMSFVGIHHTFVQQFNDRKILFFINILIGFVYGVTKSSTLVLMMYSSVMIRRTLNETKNSINSVKSGSKEKIQTICHSVLDLRQKLQKMYSSLGFIVVVKMFVNGILLSSGLCGLANHFNRDGSTPGDVDLNAVTAIGCFCLTSILDLFGGCYASQLIINAMTKLCQTIELRMITDPLTSDENEQLKVVLGIRKSMKYNVLGLFDLKTITILIVINYAANFAVILIQTK